MPRRDLHYSELEEVYEKAKRAMALRDNGPLADYWEAMCDLQATLNRLEAAAEAGYAEVEE